MVIYHNSSIGWVGIYLKIERKIGLPLTIGVLLVLL